MKTTNQNLGPLRVQADPEFAGLHPLHDNRFITVGEHDLGTIFFRDDPQSFVVCKMTDCPHQSDYARLFAGSPDLLAFAIECANDGDDRISPGLAAKARAVVAKATQPA